MSIFGIGWAAGNHWPELYLPGEEDRMNRYVRIALLALSLFVAGSGIAHAVVPVPEIDPSMASGALALLACGVLILRSRFTRR